MPRAQRTRIFPFSIQLVANLPISMFLFTIEHLAPANSAFGLTFKATKRYKKFPCRGNLN
jgi:hypothetical protein